MEMIKNFIPIILVVLAIIVPTWIVTLPYKMKNDKDGKIMFILSIIYNFLLGVLGFSIAFLGGCIVLSFFINTSFINTSSENMYLFYITYAIIMILVIYLLFIKINIFMKKKIKMNLIVYIILVISMFVLGIIAFNVFIEYTMLTKVISGIAVLELGIGACISSAYFMEDKKTK